MTRASYFVVLCLGLTGCLNGGNQTCRSNGIVPATGVTGPKTVTVNQAAVYTIDYELAACGSFLGTAEQATGNSRLIGVNVQFDGCNCPSTVSQQTATYTFQPTQAGTYYLQFAATNGTIKDTLVVK